MSMKLGELAAPEGLIRRLSRNFDIDSSMFAARSCPKVRNVCSAGMKLPSRLFTQEGLTTL